MKGLLGLAGLLVALLIVGLLVKKQFAAMQPAVPAPASATQPGTAGADVAPAARLQGSGRQIEQQYKQALDAAMRKAQPGSEHN